MKYYDKTLTTFSKIHAALPRKCTEKAFRKHLHSFEETNGLSADVRSLLADEVPVAEIRKTAADYSEKYEENEKNRAEAFRTAAAQLTASVLFIDIFEERGAWRLEQAGADVHIQTYWYWAAEYRLVLKNAVCSSTDIDGDWVELSKTTAGFLLELYSEESGYHNIAFTDAEEYIRPCTALNVNAGPFEIISNPWDYLKQVADGISEHFSCHAANEKELAAEELVFWLHDERKDAPVPACFMETARRFGADKVVEKYKKTKEKLFRALSVQQYEPLWRALYRLLADTQEGLPTKAALECSEEMLAEHRAFVTNGLKKYGFEGTYPFFFKQGVLEKTRELQAYGETYFVRRGKCARYYVVCTEFPFEDRIAMDFYSGVLFSENAEEQTDLFSCMFDRKGKAAFCCIASSEIAFEEGGAFLKARETAVSAAAKSAQLMRLSKEERRLKRRIALMPALLLMLLLMLLFMLMFFGLAMTLGFMVIEFLVVTLFTGSLSAFCEVFIETPWWLITLSSGGLFALAMVVNVWIMSRK